MFKVIHKIKSFILRIITFSSYIKFQNYLRSIGISASAVFIAIMTIAMLPITERTSTAEAIGAESSTTITLTKANADLTITPNSSDGTFASSTSEEQAQFGVKTTNYTGYTLTIEASDDSGTLTNTDSSITTDNTFSSISTVIDEKTFDSSTYNGQWGYKPSKMKSVENVGFWPAPTTTATTLDITESANPSTNNNYTIALGARAGYNQAAGTYSSTMTINTTANPSTYSITYLDNTGDTTVKNLPDITTSTTSSTSIALSRVTPSRAGYAFAGWCDQAPTSGGTVCSGNTYAVSDNYPIDQTTANYIMLYATWEIPTQDIIIKTVEGIASVSLNGTSCTTTSGCVVPGLETGQSYELSATPETGQSFGTWSNNGAGSIDDVTSNPTTYTVGEGSSTIIPTTSAGGALTDLTINFEGNAVTSVQVRTAAGADGGTLVGTVSTSGGSVSGLISGAEYYLYPSFSNGPRGSVRWSNTGYGYLICSAALSVVMSNNYNCSNTNPSIIIGAGSGAITISASIYNNLYNIVASMTKGTLASNNVALSTLITPTNSGVYTYDASTYGAATDGGSSYPIYFYRGILDNSYETTGLNGIGSYGSDGDAGVYPNYVRLGGNSTSSTCWRIVRTTGSGGVKMVYNGNWTGTTCANATTSAQLASTSAFDTTADSKGRSIVGVGYTYNANYKSTTTTTAAGTLFGTNSSYSGNTTNSTIKGVIDAWYNSNLASAYGSHLEGSAGYCNDRSVNSGNSWTSYNDSTSIDYPHGDGSLSQWGTEYSFGSCMRNWTTYQKPTLGCPRSTVDLYTTSSASNGNKQLSKPIALLTADELTFAGSSSTSGGSNSTANSFLNSGSVFWLLSPFGRYIGSAHGFTLYSSGYLYNLGNVDSAYGVRPSISLSQGAQISSGSGIATDPWVVTY